MNRLVVKPQVNTVLGIASKYMIRHCFYSVTFDNTKWRTQTMYGKNNIMKS